MPKKCIICGDPAEYLIKDTSDYYCEECAQENFGDISMLVKVEEQAKRIKKLVDEADSGGKDDDECEIEDFNEEKELPDNDIDKGPEDDIEDFSSNESEEPNDSGDGDEEESEHKKKRK